MRDLPSDFKQWGRGVSRRIIEYVFFMEQSCSMITRKRNDQTLRSRGVHIRGRSGNSFPSCSLRWDLGHVVRIFACMTTE